MASAMVLVYASTFVMERLAVIGRSGLSTIHFSGVGLGPVAAMISAILLGGTFIGITALGLILAWEIAVGYLRPALTWMTAAFGAGQMIAPVLAGIVFDVTRTFV